MTFQDLSKGAGDSGLSPEYVRGAATALKQFAGDLAKATLKAS